MQTPPDPHTTLPTPMQKFGERFLTFHWPRWFLRFPPVRGWNNLGMFDRWAVLVLVAALLFTGSFTYIAVRQANLAQQGNDFAQYGGPWTAATPGRAVLGQLQPAAVTIINESTQSEVFWIEARSQDTLVGVSGPFLLNPRQKAAASISFYPITLGEQVVVNLQLYRGSDHYAPYRNLDLWLAVRPPQ